MTNQLPEELPQTAKVAPEEFESLIEELAYAANKWEAGFDKKNTYNDWVTYICMYATEGARMSNIGQDRQYDCLIKVAGLALTAATHLRQNKMAARHYD